MLKKAKWNWIQEKSRNIKIYFIVNERMTAIHTISGSNIKGGKLEYPTPQWNREKKKHMKKQKFERKGKQ